MIYSQCTVEGCESPRRREKSGLCVKHHHRFTRNGTLELKRMQNVGKEFQQLRRHWSAMKRRCSDTSWENYHLYGGRGIKVCDRWLGNEGFWNFVADMGQPGPGLSLDRKDNDGNYEPDNCRWATASEQTLNSRQVKLTAEDIKSIRVSSEPRKNLVERYQTSPQTISRIKRNLTFSQI